MSFFCFKNEGVPRNIPEYECTIDEILHVFNGYREESRDYFEKSLRRYSVCGDFIDAGGIFFRTSRVETIEIVHQGRPPSIPLHVRENIKGWSVGQYFLHLHAHGEFQDIAHYKSVIRVTLFSGKNIDIVCHHVFAKKIRDQLISFCGAGD